MQMKLSNLVADSHGIMAVNKISFHGSDGWMEKMKLIAKTIWNENNILQMTWQFSVHSFRFQFRDRMKMCWKSREWQRKRREEREIAQNIWKCRQWIRAGEMKLSAWSVLYSYTASNSHCAHTLTSRQTDTHTTIADECDYTFMFCECEHMYLLL